MTDIFTPEKRSEIMRRIRGSGTKPERGLRELLDKLGVAYVYQARVGRWRVDFLIPHLRLIVEYRSCFWHPHEGCRLSKFPKSNTGYWIPKLQRNMERDMRKDAELANLGFKVFVIRDCDRKIRMKELENLLGVGSGVR
jgi:DNA mismatch endonuclease (patch repair protein)